MVKFILTEEQVADVLSASQKISGYVRSIETILAENAELYTEPKPQSEPTFEQALRMVFGNSKCLQYIEEQIEMIMENYDPEDLCDLSVDEHYDSRVTIEIGKRYDVSEKVAYNVKCFLQDLVNPHSSQMEELLDRCKPDEEEEA